MIIVDATEIVLPQDHYHPVLERPFADPTVFLCSFKKMHSFDGFLLPHEAHQVCQVYVPALFVDSRSRI
jgi:hypothetical protein